MDQPSVLVCSILDMVRIFRNSPESEWNTLELDVSFCVEIGIDLHRPFKKEDDH